MRVSSEEQRDAGTIETQREFLLCHAERSGFEVAETYADDGVSGTIPLHERPEGRRLLEDAREGKFGAVLVYRLDRLGRALLVVVDAHDRLEALGVGLVSTTEHIDTTTPSGRLHFQILGSFGEFERGTIRERTQAGLHRAYRNGRQTGAIPYGFTIGEDDTFVVAEDEARVVAQIFENIAGGATLYSEAKRLNDLGVPPPGVRYRSGKHIPGKRWSPPTIRNIVHQRAYSGTHEVRVNGGKDLITREVPVIVALELQQRALRVVAENKRYSGGRKHRNYLLAGLVTCETCGCACSGRTHITRGKKYPYYRCTDSHPARSYRGPIHEAPFVPAEWLEETVWADVRQFLENPGETLTRVRKQLSSDGATTELEERLADLTKRLTSKHTERDRWLHLYAQGHISDVELEIHLADHRGQLDNLKLLIDSVESDLAARKQNRLAAESVAAWLLTLRERVGEVEANTDEAFAKRREIVKLLVERG